MKFVADLQIHSKYARATSPEMTIENLAKWAKIKGIKVMGTGDFTHPEWFAHLKQSLIPAEPGLYVYKGDPDVQNGVPSERATRFMMTCETSHIYTKNGRGRRVHILFWAPSLEVAAKINTQLSWVGNLKSDGRPILGIDVKELTKIVLNADASCMVIPAHAWTPWFSVFGSMSGFDSLQECFDELTPHIRAIETGLSSDPPMNWRLSQLDNVALVSNSDSHSLQRIGREANVFDTDLSYEGICNAVKDKDPKRFLYTVEFYPEEGKYHFDGHRACNISFSPKETKAHAGKCPVCGKSLTIGVLYRVEQLADRPEGFELPGAIPFKNFIPLDEIVAESMGVTTKTKRVEQAYFDLCEKLGGELHILDDIDTKEIAAQGYDVVAEGIARMRQNKVKRVAGYDGEYGRITLFEEGEQKDITSQKSLF